MSLFHKLARRPLRVALSVAFLAGVLGVFAQQSGSGPWPLFHQGVRRNGQALSNLAARNTITGTVRQNDPALRWNFPHLIPNQARTEQPLPWNLGHIVASPTIGLAGTALNSTAGVFFASFDRFKVEKPPVVTPIDDQTSGRKFLRYSLENYGTVWSVGAQTGPNLNALSDAWWWGYRDAQVEFRDYNGTKLSAEPPPDDTSSPNETQGIHYRRIPGIQGGPGEDPNVAGLTNDDINAGRIRLGPDKFTNREFQFLRMVSRATVASLPTALIAAESSASRPGETPAQTTARIRPLQETRLPVSPIRSTPSYIHLPAPIAYTQQFISDGNLNGFNNLEDLYDAVDATGARRVPIATAPGATSDLLVFGADDGYIYCLDASNWHTYNWTDPEGQAHTTRVAHLVWRFNTVSFLTAPEQDPLVVGYSRASVNSSPLLLPSLGGIATPVAVVGTGNGRIAALDLATGQVKRAATSGYLMYLNSGLTGKDIDIFAFAPISASPALFGKLVIFGADDGTVYAWNPDATGAGVNPIQWKFDTNDELGPVLGNILRNDNKPILASPVVLPAAEAGSDMVLVGATTLKGDDANQPGPTGTPLTGGALYAINANTGKQLWSFNRWFDVRLADPARLDQPDADENKLARVNIGAIRATPTFSPTVTIANRAGAQKVAFVRPQDGNLYAILTDPAITQSRDRMAWKVPVDLGGDTTSVNDLPSSPVVTQDGRFVFVGSKDGHIRGIDPSSVSNLRLSNNSLSDTLYPSGQITWQYSTGVVKLDEAAGYNPRLGTQQYDSVNRPIYASPAIAPGYLYVACDGAVFAYQDTLGGTINVINPFDRIVGDRGPSRPEQPGQGSVNATDENKRIQADIVDEATYNSIGNASNASTFGTDSTQHLISTANKGTGGHAWTAADPGRVEWGDLIRVVAWNIPYSTAANAWVEFRLAGPNGEMRLRVKMNAITGTGFYGGDRTGYAKYTFVLDPYTQRIRVVDPQLTNGAQQVIANPLSGQALTPGGDGTPTWSITSSYGGENTNAANTLAKFRINNPIEIWEPRSGLNADQPTTQSLLGVNGNKDIQINGNTRVPVQRFTVGRHNSTSTPTYFAVSDRSNLYKLANVTDYRLPGTAAPHLRVKIAPAELEWLGGGKSVYKPLFPSYLDPSGAAVQAAPPAFSPLAPPYNPDPRTNPADSRFFTEIPPAPPGLPNFSPDYRNMAGEVLAFSANPAPGVFCSDLVHTDCPLPYKNASNLGKTFINYSARVPQFQPANIAPLGAGYATVNPTNSFTNAAYGNPALTTTDLGSANGSILTNRYMANLPNDNNYLTRVYADTNLHGTPDNNEAYRATVTGVQVQADESVEAVYDTVDLPGKGSAPNVPTPPGIAHGFVPYARFNRSASDQPEDPGMLAAQSPFFQPTLLVNNGNVNLWSVRMGKNACLDYRQSLSLTCVPPLTSPTVDPALNQSPQGAARASGSIDPGNLISTLDVEPGRNPADPNTWIPAQKARVGSAQGAALRMADPFDFTATPQTRYQGRPRVSLATPLGVPVGKYVTQPVFFEDGKFYGPPGGPRNQTNSWMPSADGRMTLNVEDPNSPTGQKLATDESATKHTLVAAEVMEARLSGYQSLAFSTPFAGLPGYFPPPNLVVPNFVRELPYSLQPGALPAWAANTLPPSSAAPAAYRDAGGNLHVIWTSNRSDGASDTEWQLWTSMLQYRTPGAVNPWGWMYQNGSGIFFSPTPGAYWWTNPKALPLPPPVAANLPSRIVGSPAVVADNQGGGSAYLFFQGITDLYDPTTGPRRITRLFYATLNNGGDITGPIVAFPWDQEIPVEAPRPFLFTANSGQRIGLVWHGGAGNQWRLFISSCPIGSFNNPDSWTRPVQLPTPAGLKYAQNPSPYVKANVNGQPFIDVVYSGFNTAANNADLYLQRFTASADLTQWNVTPLPATVNEIVRRLPGRPEYASRGIDWAFLPQPQTSIVWQRRNGTRLTFDTPDTVNQDTGVRTYVQGDYTLTVDPGAGHLLFSSSDPVEFPLPGSNDQVLVTYVPRAWQITADLRQDTQPIFFIDRSKELIPPSQPYRYPPNVSRSGPLIVERSRMWIVWRKGATPAGGSSSDPSGQAVSNATSLWYKTYRLTANLNTPIPVDTAAAAPQVTVSGSTGPWTVDVGSGGQNGRIFFTEEDEGKIVTVTVPGKTPLKVAVTWQPERPGLTNQEVQVPMKLPLNEGQVWAFKDPFGYVDPGAADTTGYNNNLWLFWSSSRGGVSDIYYQTISPTW